MIQRHNPDGSTQFWRSRWSWAKSVLSEWVDPTREPRRVRRPPIFLYIRQKIWGVRSSFRAWRLTKIYNFRWWLWEKLQPPLGDYEQRCEQMIRMLLSKPNWKALVHMAVSGPITGCNDDIPELNVSDLEEERRRALENRE